jgi:hypothetical protein
VVGLLALVVAAARAAGDAPAGLWVTVLIALVVSAGGAVAAAMLTPTPEEPMKRIRRVALAWFALTIVSCPFAYGAPLVLTVPGLAALMARWYVGPSHMPGRTTACIFLGPAILIGVVWFAARVDEVPAEALPAGGLIAIGVVGLRQLRRQSRGLASKHARARSR